MTDVQPATLRELTESAELVLEATVSKLKSYLTPDEENILTDYQIVPVRVFVSRVPAGRGAPGPAVPLVLTMYGGDLTIDGTRVSVVDHAVKRLQAGRRYLLFLQRFGSQGHFQLQGGGAFEIDSQELKTILARDENIYREFVETPFNEVVNRINAAASGRRQ